MAYLFTSESVSEGHPDKVADQISDALIDHFMAFDPSSKVACETLGIRLKIGNTAFIKTLFPPSKYLMRKIVLTQCLGDTQLICFIVD